MNANNLTNTGLSVQTLLDTIKAVGEQHPDSPDYVQVELFRDGSWNLKTETRFDDSYPERIATGIHINEDFIPNVAEWLENQS